MLFIASGATGTGHAEGCFLLLYKIVLSHYIKITHTEYFKHKGYSNIKFLYCTIKLRHSRRSSPHSSLSSRDFMHCVWQGRGWRELLSHVRRCDGSADHVLSLCSCVSLYDRSEVTA